MQAERGARGGRGRRGGRERPEGDRERPGAAAALARGGCGDRGGRRGRGRGVEDDSDSETYGEENDEQGNFSRRKIVSNWDRYQDTEKEVNGGSGESQRGTDFSVLLSSAGDSFSQFRFAEEKEWDSETSCPKQNSALYVDSESLVRALQQLPLAVRLNVASELIQTTVPLELPQVKPKRNSDGKEPGMQLRGPISELRSAAGGCSRSLGRDSLKPSPLEGLQKAASPPQSVADHLEEELDMLLHLDAPVKEEDSISPEQTSQGQEPTSQGQEPERDGHVAQEETVPEKTSMTGEKNMEPEQPSTSKTVTEEDLEDWLDSMIS
ncbi:cell death regulator Aven [Psammomys obesus]|uniref:cell death regulator Aven n=1 Tax=Psammomys obesus TaxID=48139 RepID=UPI002452B9A3|nr:cell death regulator Aven [Psammomys obesus]